MVIGLMRKLLILKIKIMGIVNKCMLIIMSAGLMLSSCITNSKSTQRNIDDNLVISNINGLAKRILKTKQYCNAQFTIIDEQLSLPDKLPLPKTAERIKTDYKFRYFFNVCTFSYTMAWWNWEQWVQGFSGHVPESISKIYPEAKLHKTGDWSAGSRIIILSFGTAPNNALV